MKALMLVEYGKFDLVDMPVPEIGEDEVLLRVGACGICGSDVHGMDGSSGRRIPPIVMGHEAAGEIAALGKGVTGWKDGDRVIYDATFYCGRCAYCMKGQTHLCDNRQVPGVSCGDYRRHGAFAEYMVVPARVLYKIPDGMPFEHAAMAEPVAVAVHGVDRAFIEPGDRVVAVGVGMIGFLVVQVAKHAGAGHVMAVDIDPRKLVLSRANGADSGGTNSAGMEFDVAIEAVGITATVDMAIRSVRKGGNVSLVGNISPTVEMPLQAVVTRELSVYGSCGARQDNQRALDLIGSGAVNVEPMITARIPLEETAAYFDRLYRGDPALMKVMVCP